MTAAWPTGSRSPTGAGDARRDLGAAADRAAADGLANGRVEGVLVRGMRSRTSAQPINGNVKSPATSKSITPGSGNIAIGARLAETLGAYPGSEISLISPKAARPRVGTVPRIVTYTVGAIFEVGVYDYDKAFVVMPMQDAQTLLMLGDEVGMVEVQTTIPTRSARSSRRSSRWCQRQGGIIVDWRQMNSALFEALEVERVAMFVVLSLIILVAVFNILPR
jgi:lipoprotein-releasing system permease protein